jgi:hypothetical protein
VQPGEAITAADASSNGAPAAMGRTAADTSAELPAGELKWDIPSGEHTGHSELHMCQHHRNCGLHGHVRVLCPLLAHDYMQASC